MPTPRMIDENSTASVRSSRLPREPQRPHSTGRTPHWKSLVADDLGSAERRQDPAEELALANVGLDPHGVNQPVKRFRSSSRRRLLRAGAQMLADI